MESKDGLLSCSEYLRTVSYSSEAFDGNAQFGSWRRMLAPFAHVKSAETPPSRYFAKATGCSLDRLHIASVTTDGFTYSRTMRHVRDFHIEHWCLSLRKTGFEISQFGERVLREPAGGISMKSFAVPFSGGCSRTEVDYVFLSREAFQDEAHVFDAANHTTLSGSMAVILTNLISSLHQYMGHLTPADIPFATNAVSALLIATIRSSSDNLALAEDAISASRFDLAKKYIQKNLSRPDLSPMDVCRALNCSRRQLYYLFEHHGGVAKFIREQRLAACHATLENQSDHRRISSIAYDYGFTSPSQFTRQFRTRYGYSPSEAAEARFHGQAVTTTMPKTFSDWLLQMRCGESA
ncbi:helix-turn-helix domain-containing protein [Rhodobacterales bacterium]|nr:helix-turn-helix domain-containing protein [Rhodobacterales bacterium]